MWRKSVVTGARVFRAFASGPEIIPMTFSRRDYFDEIITGIKRFDSELKVYCLTASMSTIKNRIACRGDKIEGPGSDWILRRVQECVEAHKDPYFGEQVDTEERNAREVANDIICRIERFGTT